MRVFLQFLGVVAIAVTFVLLGRAIWEPEDGGRLVGTAILTGAAAFGLLCWASYTPKHSDICRGC